MKHIFKKLGSVLMAVSMVFGTATVAFAAEVPSTPISGEVISADQLLEDVPVPYASVLYNYSNDTLYESSIRTFTANATGKVRLSFASIAYDGTQSGIVTVTLEVKNSIGNWSEQGKYTFNADGEVHVKTPGTTIYNGEQCRLIIEVSSSKRMVVAGYVGVY